MLSVTAAQLKIYRAQTYRLTPRRKLKTDREALAFVNERGFVYFWPIKDVELPSLWMAVAGPRPVADAHDDPGHVTWGWKDKLLGTKEWFYAKFLRGRATMISLKTLPCFYALSENVGDSKRKCMATLFGVFTRSETAGEGSRRDILPKV